MLLFKLFYALDAKRLFNRSSFLLACFSRQTCGVVLCPLSSLVRNRFVLSCGISHIFFAAFVLFDKLKRIKIPCVYIVTRNEKDTIENFLATIKTADWDKREVVCLAFKE